MRDIFWFKIFHIPLQKENNNPMGNHSLEMKLEIYDDNEGVSIQIRQWPDFPGGLIEIHTTHNKESQEYYGKQSIVLSHAQIDLLIESLQKIKEHQNGNK